MKDLTPLQHKLYKYLKKYDGKRTTEQIAKYMNLEGKYSAKEVSRRINILDDLGVIEISYIPLQRIITVL